MSVNYIGSAESQDIFTLGSNHAAVVNGKDGGLNDIVRITANQTETVRATDDASQTILLEANAAITNYDDNGFGISFTINGGGTVSVANGSTFQIGTREFTQAEFKTFMADANVANTYTVGDVPALEVPQGTESFTIAADATASLTEAVNADVIVNASVTEVDGANVQGATLNIKFDVVGTAITFDADVTRYDDNLVIAGNTIASITAESNIETTMTLADDVTTAEVEALLNSVQRTSSNVGTADDLTITLTNGTATGTASVAVTTIAANTLAFTGLQGDYQYPTVDGVAVVIDADATINTTASIGDDFAGGGTLTIAMGTGTDLTTDILTLPVTVTGKVMVVDSNVYYNATGITETTADTLVGSITGNGTVGSDLVITLDTTNASQAAINAILQETTFDVVNTGNDGVRYIDYTLSADGQTATGQAVLAVSSSNITLTTDSDDVVALVQGDTNATLAAIVDGDSVAADGINVFTAAAGALTSEDNFSGGSTAFDKAIITMGDAVIPTIANVEVFELLSTADTDDLDFTTITNTNDMSITLGNAGTAHTTTTSLLNLDGVTSIDMGYTSGVTKTVTVTTDDAQALSITAGEALINLTGDLSSYTIDATKLNTDVTGVTVAGSSAVTITNAITNVVATTNTGDVSVALLNDVASDSITITTGTANTTITNVSGALFAADGITADIVDTVTVEADAMVDDKTLTITGDGILDINDLEADLNLANFTGNSVDVAMKNVTDDGATITLGALSDADGGSINISASTAGDAITIDATAATTVDADEDGVIDANENVTIDLDGSANVTITGSSADVDASGKTAAGTVAIETVAGSKTLVSTGVAAMTLTGAATTTTVNAAVLGAALTAGTTTAEYVADLTVTALGTIVSSSVDATYLTGDLDVTIVEATATTVTLGDAITSATVNVTENAGDGQVNIAATDYTGTLVLADSTTASNKAVITDFNATLDANNDLDASGTAAADESFGGIIEVTLADAADATITAGLGNLTVTALTTSATVEIDASAMADNTSLAIVDSTINVNTTVTGLIADMTLFGNAVALSATTVNITTGAIADGATTAIILGTDETVNITADAAISGGTTGIVTIDADLAVVGDYDGSGDGTNDTAPVITIDGDATVQVVKIHGDINVSTATGNVSLTADDENADNTLTGGLGDDTLTGDLGVDTLTGNAGTDTFAFTTFDETGYGTGNRDIITDFIINTDLISFVGMKDEAGVAIAFADLYVSKGPDSTIITIDTDTTGGTGAGKDGVFDADDIQIELTGNFGGYDIGAGSFIFG